MPHDVTQDFTGFVLHTAEGVRIIHAGFCEAESGMLYFRDVEAETVQQQRTIYSGVWPFRKLKTVTENKTISSTTTIAGVAIDKVLLLEFYPQAAGLIERGDHIQEK